MDLMNFICHRFDKESCLQDFDGCGSSTADGEFGVGSAQVKLVEQRLSVDIAMVMRGLNVFAEMAVWCVFG